MFILLLSSFHLCAASSFNLTADNEPVIQEHFGNAYLYNEIWTTLHFFDLEDLETEIKYLIQHNLKLSSECKNNRLCYHDKSLQDLRYQIYLLNERIDAIYQSTNNARNKRGLINAIGTWFKYLFGTMNADDAEQISNTLDNIYNHSSNSILFVRNQTTIVKNLLDSINKFQTQYNRDIAALNSYTGNLTLQQDFDNITFRNLYHLDLMFRHTNEIVSHIEESFQVDRTGFISPYLVTPKNLIKSLAKISLNTDKETFFGINSMNYHLFIKLSNIELFLYKRKIIYKIHTPIPNKIAYDLVKLTPLPMHVYYKYNIYINAILTPFDISQDKLEYTLIDIDNCKMLHETYFCPINCALTRVNNQICTLNLLLMNSDDHCEKGYFTSKASLFFRLRDGVSWVIFPLQEETLTIKCYKFEQTISVAIHSILTIELGCIISNAHSIFTTSSSRIRSTLEPIKIPYKLDELEKQKISINHTLPLVHGMHFDLDKIKEHTLTLRETISRYEEDLSIQRQKSFAYHAFTTLRFLSYAALFFLTGLFLYKLGCFNIFMRPFKFKWCFDTRERVPKTVHQNVQHSPGTPLIVHYNSPTNMRQQRPPMASITEHAFQRSFSATL